MLNYDFLSEIISLIKFLPYNFLEAFQVGYKIMKAAQLNQQEEQERIKKQRAELQKIKNEVRPAFAIKGKRKVVLYKK